MSDQLTHRQHADELRARAASARDPGRQKYLKGLAASYEELARQREPQPPAVAERAARPCLRNRGYSQKHIAERLGCTPQRIGQLLRETPRVEDV
jgi:hypothetical protein